MDFSYTEFVMQRFVRNHFLASIALSRVRDVIS